MSNNERQVWVAVVSNAANIIYALAVFIAVIAACFLGEPLFGLFAGAGEFLRQK